MRLDYDNLRTREDQEITAPERAESITRWSTSRHSTSCRTISR